MEEQTKNKYDYPIDLNKVTTIFYKRSPAHQDTYKNGMYKHAVDFICPIGTPIKAAADGVVVDVKFDSDKGGKDESFDELTNYIEIKHENGEYSWYEHLKKDGVLVKVGERVKRGQLIGYSGMTGWVASLQAHLHFHIGVYGKTVDDYHTLKIVWISPEKAKHLVSF